MGELPERYGKKASAAPPPALLRSFKNFSTRAIGGALPLSRLQSMELAEAKTLYEHPAIA